MISDDTPRVPDHLYTWVDIDEHFAALAAAGQWAEWLLEVDAYWDGVELTIMEGASEEGVWPWLADRLGALTVDPDRRVILLESVSDPGEALPVQIHQESNPPAPQRRPRWNERRVVRQLGDALDLPAEESLPHDVQICAFHSFKGGTGRTLHCLALARELAVRRQRGPDGAGRVLLVDADFEAPGITWMMAAQGKRLDFSLKDLLALLHGSSADGAGDAIGLARKFLANQEFEGIVVLPATRHPASLGPLRIEPVDLLTPDRPAYFLTEALAELAHAVGADTVVVDLRAGASELSAPVLLDPRVHRVFVSTVSDQSLQGTCHMIREIAHRAPSRRPTDPICAVLITQFQEKEHGHHVERAANSVVEAVATTVRAAVAGTADPDSDATDPDDGAGDSGSTVDQGVVAQPMSSPFDARLLALPAAWGEVCDLIERTELRPTVTRLADSIRPPAQPVVSGRLDQADDLVQTRARLFELAGRIVYADTADEGSDYLATEPLTNLISQHRTEAPVEVVVGAKGSGKTLTYLQICRRKTWKHFAQSTNVGGVEFDAPIVPVLASQNLSRTLHARVDDVRQAAAASLGGAPDAASFLDIRDLIRDRLGDNLPDSSWRKIWLTCLARAAGLDATPETAEDALTGLARRHRAIFVLDGLEDLFQEFSTDPHQQQALRALLTGCPEWLRSLRGHPLGLIAFVRRDLVLNAVRQNTNQFFARHRAYELRWNRTEALRLTAWVCERAGALRMPEDGTAQTMTPPALSRTLTQVWGQKLGSDKSREARSEDWFLAALSDFNLQIQARDIVSFLGKAAHHAMDERAAGRRTDRLLPPSAMRRALPECSRDRVDAISDENPPVRQLFGRLRELPTEFRKVPFTLQQVGLESDEARLLEANGVLFREDDQYWIPEIYRHGLGFTSTGRPRMLAIARMVQGQNTLG